MMPEMHLLRTPTWSCALALIALSVAASASELRGADDVEAVCAYSEAVEFAFPTLLRTSWDAPQDEPVVSRSPVEPRALTETVEPEVADLAPAPPSVLPDEVVDAQPPVPSGPEHDPILVALRARDYARTRADVVRDGYEIVVASQAFPIWSWDPDTAALVALVPEDIPVFDGASSLSVGANEPLRFPMDEATADTALAAHAIGNLFVRLQLTLTARSEPWGAICVGSDDGFPVLDVELVSAELEDSWAPTPSARAETVAFDEARVEAEATRAGLTERGEPSVDVTSVEFEGGGGCHSDEMAVLGATLEALFTECYLAGLDRNAGLRGALVFGFDLDARGRASDPEIEIDVLDDERVRDCALAVLDRVAIYRDADAVPGHVRTRVRFARQE